MYIMRATIARWGNSLALRIPKAAVEAAGLHEGDVVDIDEDAGVLHIARARRVDVDALIAAITPENLHRDLAWLETEPRGNEGW